MALAGERPAPGGARVRGVAHRVPVGADRSTLHGQVSSPMTQVGRRAPGGEGRGPSGWPLGGLAPALPRLSCRQALPSEYRVRLGLLRLRPALPPALSVPVWRVLLPPDHSTDAARGDLALLQLRHPVPLSAHIQPICLPMPGAHPPPSSPCWVTGWGTLRPGGEA